MSLARAFTTIGRRNKKSDEDLSANASTYVGRAASQRGGRPVPRTAISSPLSLVSTSNMQVHNAKTIAGTNPIEIQHVASGTTSSSSSSVSGGEDSDDGTLISGHDTATDASSMDESPCRPEPEPNHLSCYFRPAVDTRSDTGSSSPTLSSHSSGSFDDTPRIPQRVPSHSKKAHERLHRTRSLQRMMSPPPTARRRAFTSETSTRSSSSEVFASGASDATMSFVEAPRETPFGAELAQLDEVAEEFGQVVQKAEAEADAVFMETHGLARFAPADYMLEIQALVYETFGTVGHEGSGDWF